MMKRTFLILLFCSLFFITTVSAESGTISLVDETQKLGYTVGAGSTYSLGFNWSAIAFDNTDYNKMYYFKIDMSSPVGQGMFTFNKDGDSTPFHCINGATCTGYATYSKSKNTIEYFFDPDIEITDSTIVLSFDNDIWTGAFSYTPSWDYLGIGSVGVNTPSCIKSGSSCTGGMGHFANYYFVYSATVGVNIQNSYTVTYGSGGTFSAYIHKGTVGTKISLHNATSADNYGYQTSFTTGWYNQTAIYNNGLWINMSVASGRYIDTLINSSVAGGGTPTTSATGTIAFNNSSVALGQDFDVYWTLTNPNTACSYYVQLKNTDTQEIIKTYVIAPISGSAVFTNNILKTPLQANYYETYLVQGCSLYDIKTLGSDQVYYGNYIPNPLTSATGNLTILNPGKQVLQGDWLNVKYNISVSGQINIYDYMQVWQYSVSAGNNKQIDLYIPENANIGTQAIYIEYYDYFNGQWVGLDTDNFTVLPKSNFSLTVGKDSYYKGETITATAFNTNTGYVVFVNPNGTIRLNRSILGNVTTTAVYTTQNSDVRGTWFIKLYDYNGVLLETVSTYLNYGNTVTPGPTGPSSAGGSGGGTIDYVGNKTARKDAENGFFNTFYGAMNALFTLAILATMVMFLKLMGKW